MERHLGFGITGAPRPWLPELGAALERLGYDELWSNDTRRGSGPATLAAAAPPSPQMDLCVGVVGLSERSAAVVADEVRGLALPLDRLVIGVGSGRSRSVELVRDGVETLRSSLPGARIAVAALGPRMLRLAGETADVVLLNWAAPARVVASRERIDAGAAAAGRPVPRVAAYVRVAVGPGATARLDAELEGYRRSPAYARQVAEQGAALLGVAAEEPDEVPAALAPYRSVLDSCVVRGLPERDDLESWLAIARAAAAA